MISEEKIKEIIREETRDNKITCAKLYEIGETHGVPLNKLGEITNALKIKITRCQLGCF